MAFILKDSPECVKSELELFNLPGTQTVIQDGQWKQFHPLSNVFDNAPVEFHISGSAEDYIDLSQTQLYVKAKIVKVDNTPITKDDTIGPVNLFLHSLFSQVDVSLNDRVVSNSSNTYPYRSYIETLLNHGYDSKTSQLTAELFYKDSDDGLKKRTEFFKESATVDMIGCIHSDLFHQDRLLLNLVDLKIKLIRSKPEFCLQGSEGFKVVLDHVSLFIRKVRVNPGVILGCVDNEAFHGAFSKSPYEFKHFNLNFIGVYVDGQPVPHNPLELDFSKDQYIRAYQTLFVGTDRMGQDRVKSIAKKRKRQFYGNKFTNTSKNNSTSAVPECTVSCWEMRVCQLQKKWRSEKLPGPVFGNRIIDLELIVEAFAQLCCPKYFAEKVELFEDSRYGLCSHFTLKLEYFLMVFDRLEQVGLGTEHMALGVIVHCLDSGLRRQWVCSLNGLRETPLFIF
ncbi:uncharacterized protein F54H12.2 [Trichonephila clavipes]|nr:uncharacterized protein F54H12.2 [Trichonephila clavipes]